MKSPLPDEYNVPAVVKSYNYYISARLTNIKVSKSRALRKLMDVFSF